ncbi:hypothetical protein AURDEDRAFT_117657 [Auricularia subglabra TFB-10046 SS5]|uniref:Uncharacterized protein n=1 Tax=Auricularia subglabra (strain TFB-10046 / SS5) TaxID=717982 RepID=J0WQY7_AURST|nr:hypothetical protein AURDEDRAFT_117657 [Auricularia subglabra TFB-10046 SS5]
MAAPSKASSAGSIDRRVTRSLSGLTTSRKDSKASVAADDVATISSSSEDEDEGPRKRRRTTNGKKPTAPTSAQLNSLSAKMDTLLGSAMTHRDYVELRDLLVAVKNDVSGAGFKGDHDGTQETKDLRHKLASAREEAAQAMKRVEKLEYKRSIADGRVADRDSAIKKLEDAARVNDIALHLYQQLTDLTLSVLPNERDDTKFVVNCDFAPKWNDATRFVFSLEFVDDESGGDSVVFSPSLSDARGAARSNAFYEFHERCKLPPSGLSSFFLMMLEQCHAT